jgi:hypothetical protein
MKRAAAAAREAAAGTAWSELADGGGRPPQSAAPERAAPACREVLHRRATPSRKTVAWGRFRDAPPIFFFARPLRARLAESDLAHTTRLPRSGLSRH